MAKKYLKREVFNLVDKLKLTRLFLGRVFSSRRGCTNDTRELGSVAKLPDVELKTWLVQL
jgi:hypothetical protein